MENGRIKAIGTFSELIEKEEAFSSFVGANTQFSCVDEDTVNKSVSSEQTISLGQQGEELIVEEEMRKNRIPWRLYASYICFSHLKTWFYLISILLLYVSAQVANVLWGLEFAWWTSQAYGVSSKDWVGIFVSTHFTQLILLLEGFNAVQQALTYCAEQAGNRALEGVLKAPMAFLDTTPVGRIINRFTQVSEECLYYSILSLLLTFLGCI